jgi:hypothetical protein
VRIDFSEGGAPNKGRRAAYGDVPLDVENPESHTAGHQKPFGLPAIKLA